MAVTLSGEHTHHGPSIEFLSQCLRDATPPKSSQETRYDKAVQLARCGKFDEALQIAKQGRDDPFQNLAAVLLMRLDRAEEAVSILRRLALLSNPLDLKPDVSITIRINLLTALFMTGQVAGCLEIMGDLPQQFTSQLEPLRENIKAWEKSLTGWKWLDWKFCGIAHHDGPIPINFVPGVLENELTEPYRDAEPAAALSNRLDGSAPT